MYEHDPNVGQLSPSCHLGCGIRHGCQEAISLAWWSFWHQGSRDGPWPVLPTPQPLLLLLPPQASPEPPQPDLKQGGYALKTRFLCRTPQKPAEFWEFPWSAEAESSMGCIALGIR